MVYVLIAVIVLAVVAFVCIESSGFKTVEYRLTTDKNIGGPVRFVMISDLHDTDVTHDHNRRLLDAVRKASPDFVILAGDMITSYMQPRYDSTVTLEFLKDLASEFTVYYGLGNHEQRYREEPERFPGKFDALMKFTKSLRINVLSDESIDVPEKNIRIFGFDIPMVNYKRAVKTKLCDGILENIFQKPDESTYNILIAHNPVFFDEYSKWGPDLVLSGHVHGGVIGIPFVGGLISPQLELFPKYDHGLFTENGTAMIVSRGIGWHSIPVRIFNKAEIVSVVIDNK